MRYHLYMLRCVDGTLYTGITTDLHRRMREHESQGARCAKYMRGRNPFRLVFHRVYKTRSRAQKEEYRIKTLKREAKELIINQAGISAPLSRQV